ncbi:MAG: helix-turn-helix domain-containing protein [Niabella sp.]
MGVCLLVVSVPREPQLKNYRTSRCFLALAYILLAAIGLWGTFGQRESGENTLVAAFTLIAASFQALLFMVSFITLINLGFITKHRIWRHIVPLLLASAVLLTVLFTASELTFFTSFYTMLALYCVQLVVYIIVFVREYKRYRLKLDNFFSENEERRLAWVKRAFFMAAAVGFIAVGSLFVNQTLYIIFTFAYTLFYIYFAIKYISYVSLFHRFAPVVAATVAEPETRQEANDSRLSHELQKWVAEKKFIHTDITLESLSLELTTNYAYLSRYINSHYGQNFKSWINSLRIAEAQRLIAEQEDLSFIEIGEQVGIPSISTFYRQFSTVTGVTPAEYRRQHSISPVSV